MGFARIFSSLGSQEIYLKPQRYKTVSTPSWVHNCTKRTLEQPFLVFKIFVFIFFCLFLYLKIYFLGKKNISMSWQIPLFRLCQSSVLLSISNDSINYSLQNTVPGTYISVYKRKMRCHFLYTVLLLINDENSANVM